MYINETVCILTEQPTVPWAQRLVNDESGYGIWHYDQCAVNFKSKKKKVLFNTIGLLPRILKLKLPIMVISYCYHGMGKQNFQSVPYLSFVNRTFSFSILTHRFIIHAHAFANSFADCTHDLWPSLIYNDMNGCHRNAWCILYWCFPIEKNVLG